MEYLCAQALTESDATELRQILVSHHGWTQSRTAAVALDDSAWNRFAATFVKCVPAAQVASLPAATAAPAA